MSIELTPIALRSVRLLPIELVSIGGVARGELINALFGAGEQGALYDPSDLSTMYQDSNAAIPVTGADQPVRMLLDLSKERALGPELHTPNLSDPAWDSNVEAWVMYRTAEASRNYTTNATITAGKWYVLDFMASHDPQQPTSSAVFRVGPSNFGFLSIHGLPVEPTRYVRIVKVTTSGAISAYGGDSNGASWRLHSLSVKEIAGNHAMAPSDAARPLAKANPWRVDYDGVDDLLRTVFPDLGTDCTVGRAVPGVGASILTGQTISGNLDDSTDHAGLVIVDRALTAGETDMLTQWLDRQAGV